MDTGEADTAFGRALLQVRYRALQRQIPLLYLITLANFVGFKLSRGPTADSLFHPANLIIALILVRLGHWVRTRGRELPPERILRELKQTLILAGILSAAAGIQAIALIAEGNPEQQGPVILFGSLAAIGCAYGLSSFPAAARLPLLLFALPFAAMLAVSPDPSHVAVGASLVLIILLTLRLVDLYNGSFIELVRSRSAIDIERERADRAKIAALSDKARADQIANSDPLTGLANRRAFMGSLEALLHGSTGPSFLLALVDLDSFKPINDTFGHASGDAVLVEVAVRLRGESGDGAIAARIGGDEFALLIPVAGTRDEHLAVQIGVAICGAIGRPYRIEGREFRISACCGLVLLQPGECDVTTALRRGDAALYSGKQRGRGSVALFTPELEEANQRRIAIERALRAPKVHEQIKLVFQPIFDLNSGAIRAFEVLARWQHPELGRISPSEFIPITEQINVIETISERLLARAAAQAATWPEAVHLSFNLSAVQLCSAASAQRMLAIIAEQSLEPERLRVEVTETTLLTDFETARLNLNALREAGVRIVLDDFGAGFASISYLREMRFDSIKLDGSLIIGAARSASAQRLLRGVLDLCASLNVPCVAEHIENDDQIALLRRLNCRDGQGFALSPPLDADAAREVAAARLVPFRAPGRPHRAA